MGSLCDKHGKGEKHIPTDGNNPFGIHGQRLQGNIKVNLNKMDRCGLDSFSLVWVRVMSSSERGFGPSGSIKVENVLGGDLSRHCAPWGLLIYFESHRTVNPNELCLPLLVNLPIFYFDLVHSLQ
jgi:hypothetical protein